MIRESRDDLLRFFVDHDVTVWHSANAAIDIDDVGPDLPILRVARVGGDELTVVLEVPLRDAVGYWYPSGGASRTLPPDWRGQEAISAAMSSPIGCLFGRDGNAQIAWACDVTDLEIHARFGVSEETATFIVELTVPVSVETVSIAWLVGGDACATISRLVSWQTAGRTVARSDIDEDPVYSSWYVSHADVSDREVREQSTAARALGLSSVILDYGWQQHGDSRFFDGCGDWNADTAKFPDLAETVRELQRQGSTVTLWIAPLLLGERSAAYAGLSAFAPLRREALRAHVLDPRHAEVRDWVVEQCVGLIDRYGVDGLKIDFIDEAAAYGRDGQGDVGEAVRQLFDQLQAALGRRRPVLIELRQPYVSEALARVGTCVRAFDCPGDPTVNRQSIFDLRLALPHRQVHSDMMMWDVSIDSPAVSRILHNALFSVPQVSMDVRKIPASHVDALRAWLVLWRRVKDLALHGAIRTTQLHGNAPVISVEGETDALVGVYETGQVVRLPPAHSVIVVNGTPDDLLVVRAGRRAIVRTFDNLGEGVGRATLSLGVQEVEVPSGGWLEVEADGDD